MQLAARWESSSTGRGNRPFNARSRESISGVAPEISSSFADGESAYSARKYAEAAAIFEGYVARRPNNAWGHYMVGLSALKNGDLAKSEPSLLMILVSCVRSSVCQRS